MEQTKNEPKNENKAAPDNGKPKKERKPLTEAQRLKRQKMIVLPAMVLVFLGAMWLIFAPSSGKEQEPGTGGYNIEMPDADKANRQIIGDKAKAYEQGAMEERQADRSRAMQELGDMFDSEVAETDGGDFDLANPGGTEENVKSAPKTIQSSAAAYRDLNATLGNFYEQPKNDNADMDELLERIASLESELESEKGKASAMDDQVALMEKSYELAAKYMGGQNGGKPEPVRAAEPYPVQKAGKNTAKPVRQVAHQVVSSLGQPMSNAEFVASFSQERNRSFNTAVGVTTVSDRNTIPACVYGAQSVTDGQAVKLRLLEPMAVADKIIPRNAVVVGTAKIQGERLDIEITSLEYTGTIIPVDLAVYDTDGQPGIFIPNSMEMNAVREVAANMGGSLGSSINISTNAGAQLASDLGKGLIQGTSQYIAKKMRTDGAHLKAGYRVMLYQEKD
ncbi:conjugative transposon protein TraM [Bacteroides ovatus]|uniref:conjugative transposon protein TraM n=1 Tax=Bacteroides ovatus TaxID=28116 RepID=UPI001CCEEB13|nr:conjugative transposon protein TraM [Bacteroides ovatus]MCS2472715.1 conjugative transposon protein TraM [Bacteroides ovatus]MCS3102002.1 conjugative transposon protein TraM [Bacteroides ovatus]UBF09227.1 conjugative transposon protein TraM [Bacteroides ovatus]